MGAIGVFDSGYGGLTILKSLLEKLPEYDFIYYGDNNRAPYGTRSFEEVYEFTLDAVQKLFEKGCPLVILACNTASAKALRTIQQKYVPANAPDKRVLGVIRPSAEVVGALSKTHHIGLLATEGTVRSESYRLELEKFSPHIFLYQHACPTWVPLIEAGEIFSEEGKLQIQEDISKLLEQSEEMDTILLACTHYPIIESYLRTIVPSSIQLVSQGDIVSDSLSDYLKRHAEMEEQLTKNGTVEYYTSGDPELFDLQAEKIIHMKTRARLME
jgi:glutamate racemase